MTEQNTHADSKQNNADGKSRGRRRFLGAGAATTPFLLTLVSQPALGVACFTPSRSLSKNTSLSQQDKYGNCLNAKSPSSYAAQASTGDGWPVPPTTLMHPTFYQGGVLLKTYFAKPTGPNGELTSMTLGEAIQETSQGQVHAYLIAAYLNKRGGGGAVIPDNVLTETDILGMWQEYVTKGFFEPMAGINWYADDIINYLQTNGIVG
ncbi:MAG: hypothetical protein LBE62_00080 [Azonexus sp.]|jgi:hypothetical protein|nr:hypothetical protein [Azonexus sp.]